MILTRGKKNEVSRVMELVVIRYRQNIGIEFWLCYFIFVIISFEFAG